MAKILFLLKERTYSHAKTSYGLINSATHIARFLATLGHECKIVQVLDSNFIDKEVYEFKPSIVILEALWVPGYKIKELLNIKRYKRIRWIVRVHSDMGYLSAESNAIQLLNEYINLHEHHLTLSLNNKEFVESLSSAMRYDFTYLPNVITISDDIPDDYIEDRHHIDIGCFGAMRLLKNQCFQAICAINAADKLEKKLHFHITPNLGIENDPVLKNLQELFKIRPHELIVHDWLPNDEFQRLVRRMDIGLQISHTESFNIVTADFINNNRLILVSDAISWMPSIFKTSTIDYDEVTRKIIQMYKRRNSIALKTRALNHLISYNENAQQEWIRFLHSHRH
jgi:hypothetical protein